MPGTCLAKEPLVGELGSVDRFWATRALEFVTALAAVAACEDVMALFRREIAQVGFSSYIMVTAIDGRDLKRRLLARGWHREWAAIYAKRNLQEADPVRRQISLSTNPFLWSEVSYDPAREPRAKFTMERAADFGMTEGFCVPIRYGPAVAAISIGGDKPDFGPGVRTALHIISLFTYNRFRAIIESSSFQCQKLLTDREREVLQWVSVGKSDWDISTILNISERTARAHVTNAARKLNAANRPAAIAEALRVGEISLNY